MSECNDHEARCSGPETDGQSPEMRSNLPHSNKGRGVFVASWFLFKAAIRFVKMRGAEAARDGLEDAGLELIAALSKSRFIRYVIIAIISGSISFLATFIALSIDFAGLKQMRLQTNELLEQNNLMRQQSLTQLRVSNATAVSAFIDELDASLKEEDSLSTLQQYRLAAIVEAIEPMQHPLGDSLSSGRGLMLRALTDLGVEFPLEVNPNFSYSELRSANFRNRVLRSVNLQHSYLRGAELQEADLYSANFRHANLGGAQLTKANLTFAGLQRAELSNAQAREAVLHRAQLMNATLKSVCLKGSDLTIADLTGADLENTDANGAKLYGAILTNTNLWGADFTNADLRFAKVGNARISSGTNFQSALIDTSFFQSALIETASKFVIYRDPRTKRDTLVAFVPHALSKGAIAIGPDEDSLSSLRAYGVLPPEEQATSYSVGKQICVDDE